MPNKRHKIPDKGRTCTDCGLPHRTPKQEPRRCHQCATAYQNSLKEKHWNYKGGKYTTSQGYVHSSAREHPFCSSKGVVLEHRLVMEKHLGRYLTKNEVVHHINGIKHDNRVENLVVCSTQKMHKAFHLKNGGKCRLCDGKHRSKGLCHRHYKRLLYFRDMGEPIAFSDSTEKLMATIGTPMPWYTNERKKRFAAYK